MSYLRVLCYTCFLACIVVAYGEQSTGDTVEKEEVECPEHILTNLEGYLGARATCYNLRMPVDHSGTITEDTFDYFVTCFGPENGGEKVLWLHQGGPGAPGHAMLGLPSILLRAGLVSKGEVTWDFCVPDHRGTGYSNQLYCEDNSHLSLHPTEECYERLMESQEPFMRSMSVKNAAMDTWTAVNSFKYGAYSYLYAVSYGTNLLLKYLTYAPYENVAGVILDSVAPTFYTYQRYTEYVNVVAQEFMTLCGQKEVCWDCVGPNPAEALDLLYEEIRYGVNICWRELHALEEKNEMNLTTADNLRQLLGQLVADESWDGMNGSRNLMAPLLYRLLHCKETSDIEEVFNFIHKVPVGRRKLFEIEEDGSSQVTYFLLLAGELFGLPHSSKPADEEMQDREKLLYAGTYNPLPAYFLPALYNITMEEALRMPTLKKTSLLLLAGTLDPATVAMGARYVAERIDTSDYLATYYFPDVVHGVLGSSAPLAGTDEEEKGTTCGGNLIADFLINGRVTLDGEDCINALPDYDGVKPDTMQLSKLRFGTSRVWGSCPSSHITPPSEDTSAAGRKLIMAHAARH